MIKEQIPATVAADKMSKVQTVPAVVVAKTIAYQTVTTVDVAEDAVVMNLAAPVKTVQEIGHVNVAAVAIVNPY